MGAVKINSAHHKNEANRSVLIHKKW